VELVQGPRIARGESPVSAVEELDDAVHCFIERWPPGEHRVRFLARAEVAGDISAPAVELEPMYGDALPIRTTAVTRWSVAEGKNLP
jgi:hypothetical protein